MLLESVVFEVAAEDQVVDEERMEEGELKVEGMEVIFVAEEEDPMENSRREENQTQNVSFVMETMLLQSAAI